MKHRTLSIPYRLISTFAFLLLALPAAKSNGCGPDVPIGDDDTLGKVCGTADGVTCNTGEYCATEQSCGGAGICTAFNPGGDCILSYEPVCGCDDQTYSNPCMAHNAGVNVAYEGECGGTGVCGGIGGIQCGANEYCNYPDGSCGIADQTGVCVALPSDGCYEIYSPVCGCDGITYGNDCEAAAAGVSIASEGECQPAGGEACGGFSGGMCGSNEFCDFPENTCGIADEGGTCKTTPDACDTEFNPVCGCDGLDYGNECEAHAAGTDIASEGPCNTAP